MNGADHIPGEADHAPESAAARAPLGPALLLAGPTAGGKTALATALAERFRLEIISADSMQVYRGMEIGAAQPDAEERARARFHLCGMLDPAETFDVARWLRMCETAHREIQARGAVPVYVGGTGMYLRALRWGLLDQPEPDPALRARLEREAADLGTAALHERLGRIDPDSARAIAPADRVRIVRALELAELTGRPPSRLRGHWSDPRRRFPHVLVVLALPRPLLRCRIEARAEAMLAAGWIDETRRLLARGLDPAAHCFKALGYREIIEHLEGRLEGEQLAARIVARTVQFARRQLVWLRRERPALWIELDPGSPASALERLGRVLEKTIPSVSRRAIYLSDDVNQA